MNIKCAVLLVRVSTESQDYNAQINDLKSYARTNFGFTEFKVIHTKESGLADLEDKIGTNEMFQFLLNNKKYKTVIATEMSRLGRRQSVLHAVKEWFYKNQIQLFVKDSQFWLLNEKGEITETAEMGFTMYSLFAESEIKRKKDRFLRKRLDLMKQGYSISGKTLFGYKRVKTEGKHTTLEKDEYNSDVVLQIYNWYLNGIDSSRPNPSIQTSAQHCLKIGYPKYTHSKRNCNKLLKEEAYTGKKTTNNKRKNQKYGKVEGEAEYIITQNEIKYPIVIPEKIFIAVQEKLSSNTSGLNKYTKHTTILAKLIKCPSCGRSLSANYRFYKGGNKHSYRCTSRTDTVPCSNKQSISMSLVDSAVWCAIKGDWNALAKLINENNPLIKRGELNEQLKNIDIRLSEINDDVINQQKMLTINANLSNIDLSDLISKTTKKLERLDKEKGKLERERLNIKSQLQIVEKEEKDVKSVLDTNLHLIEKDKELLRMYITRFVKEVKILYHDRKFTVLHIALKYFTANALNFPYQSHMHKITKAQFKPNIIVLDKSRTLDIKGFKTTNDDNIKNGEEYIRPEFLEKYALPFFKFEKLNVYDS